MQHSSLLNTAQLTISLIALWMIIETDSVQKWTFRALVLSIVASWVYDVFWIILISSVRRNL